MKRRLLLLALATMSLWVIALPALAQAGESGEMITWEFLATAAGATFFGFLATEIAGTIFDNMSIRAKRLTALLGAVASMVGATVALLEVTAGLIILAVINGLVAGQAAMKTNEMISHGFSHQVTDD